MFENFSFDNLLQPKNLMAGGGLLAQMGQGMQNGGGLLGGMGAMQGGMGMLQNKEVLEALKKLLGKTGGTAAAGGLGLLMQNGGVANGQLPLLGGGPLAPWGGMTY